MESNSNCDITINKHRVAYLALFNSPIDCTDAH